MFGINDVVLYGQAEVCKIADIRALTFGAWEKQEYYVLEPLYESHGTVCYVPVKQGDKRISRLLTREEVDRLLNTEPDEKLWVENANYRHSQFSEILRRGDHEELVRLVKTIRQKQMEKAREGKKFGASDERTLLEAGKLLYQVFRHAVDIRPEEIIEFVAGESEN